MGESALQEGKDGRHRAGGSRLGCVQLLEEDRPGSKFWDQGSRLASFFLELVTTSVNERAESQ